MGLYRNGYNYHSFKLTFNYLIYCQFLVCLLSSICLTLLVYGRHCTGMLPAEKILHKYPDVSVELSNQNGSGMGTGQWLNYSL